MWADDILAWEQWRRAGRKAQGTIKLHSRYVRRVAVAIGGDPWAVTTDQLAAWLAGREDWSRATVRTAQTGLRSFFAWGRATGRRVDDPAALLPAVSAVRGVPRPASLAAFDAALAIAATARPQWLADRVTTALKLARWSGLRRAEIAGIDLRDVSGGVIRVTGKGEHVRHVPIHPEVEGLLATARTRARAADGPLWLMASMADPSRHITAVTLGKLIRRAVPAAPDAIERAVRLHACRHTFGTGALRASGGNLRVVQELLGHASVTTTQIYTAVGSDELAEAVRRLAG